MHIATRRLLLREFDDEDLPPFAAYHADPRYRQYHASKETPPDHARELLRTFAEWAVERPRRNFQLAIAGLASGKLLGCCGVRRQGLEEEAEFGIELAPDSWGRGYAAEAARAMLAFAFRELRLQEVHGISVAENARVTNLALRLEFIQVGSHRGTDPVGTRGRSRVIWRLTRERWEAGGSSDTGE